MEPWLKLWIKILLQLTVHCHGILISEDGMDVAFGVYVYHVDAPGIGEHIGKFALIK
jgi:hypothetical protein